MLSIVLKLHTFDDDGYVKQRRENSHGDSFIHESVRIILIHESLVVRMCLRLCILLYMVVVLHRYSIIDEIIGDIVFHVVSLPRS